MYIEDVNPLNSPLWQQLTKRHQSTVFHSPEWLGVLHDTYGFAIHAHILLNEAQEPKAGVAYCAINDMMDPRIASLPFSDFCDPLVSNLDEWHCLADKLLSRGHRISLRCLHNQVALDDKRFTLAGRAKWHCVDLERSEDAVWQGLHGSARRAVKKAQRNGVTVRIAQNKEDLRAFFELHLRVRKYKYGLLAQPYRFFENIWNRFILPGKGALLLAAHENEVIGGVLFLEWQDTLYYKFNASNPDAIAVRPNDLVVWEGIRYGQSRQLHFLDFGLSDWDQEGLLQYKRKFATDEKTISMLRYSPENSPSIKEKQLRQLLPKLTDLFVDGSIPDTITEKAGDTLYQFFT
jgi:CelD/BcsL family acetyltransferase involved in cellulose biosynthesis